MKCRFTGAHAVVFFGRGLNVQQGNCNVCIVSPLLVKLQAVKSTEKTWRDRMII